MSDSQNAHNNRAYIVFYSYKSSFVSPLTSNMPSSSSSIIKIHRLKSAVPNAKRTEKKHSCISFAFNRLPFYCCCRRFSNNSKNIQINKS